MPFFLAPYEPRYLVYTGTSITAGSAATAGNDFATLTSEWTRNQRPFYALDWHNSGVGGSASWCALADIQAAIVAYSPDVVNIEFTTNIAVDDFSRRTSEALIRRLRTLLPNARLTYSSAIRVNDHDVDDPTNVDSAKAAIWQAFCSYYGIPFYNYATDVAAAVTGGTHLNALLSDEVHPTNAGHLLFSQGLRSYILSAMVNTPMIALPVSRLYDDGYFEADPVIRNCSDNDGETGTWTDSGSGRKSSVAGSTMTFTGTFMTCGFEDGTDVGEVRWRIDGGVWNNQLLYAYGGVKNLGYTLYADAPHTVEFEVVSGTVNMQRFFTI